jgi:hypothetical protein
LIIVCDCCSGHEQIAIVEEEEGELFGNDEWSSRGREIDLRLGKAPHAKYSWSIAEEQLGI